MIPFHFAPLVLLLLIAVSSFGQVGELHTTLASIGYDRTKDGIRHCLSDIVWTEEREALFQKCLVDLDSDEFVTRESAMLSLANLPSMPYGRLKSEVDRSSVPVDKKSRILHVLDTNTPERVELIVYLAAKAITAERHAGLAGELLAATEAVQVTQRPVWDAVLWAMRSTATDREIDALQAGLFLPGAMARAAAVVGLSTVDPDAALVALKPILEDADERVRYHAAEEMRELGSRDCLPAFVSLLDSSVSNQSWDVHLRFRSVRALRELTGKRFGYRASYSPKDRKPYIEAWEEWIKENGDTAPLHFESAAKAGGFMRDHDGKGMIVDSPEIRRLIWTSRQKHHNVAEAGG